MSAVAMLPNAPRFDTIYLRNLQLSAVIGSDAWNRPDRAQPIILSIQLQIDTTSAGISDDIKHTFSYGQLCKDITTNVDGKTFISIENLAGDVTRLAGHWPGKTLRLQVLAPKAMLRVEGGFGCDLFLRRSETEASGREAPDWGLESYEWVVRGLKLACIIGVNPHERLEKQNLSIDLHIRKEADSAQYGLQVNDGDWQRLVKRLGEVSHQSSFPSSPPLFFFFFFLFLFFLLTDDETD